MFIKDLLPAIKTLMKANVTACLVGPPGCGKTAIAQQASHSEGMDFLYIHGPTSDPVDRTGLPKVEGQYTEWTIPAFLPREDSPPTVIFIDELDKCSQSARHGFSQAFHERRMGDYQIRPQDYVMVAMNRVEDRTGGTRLMTHETNRLCFLEIEPRSQDFLQWAIPNGIHLDICTFLRNCPDLAHNPLWYTDRHKPVIETNKPYPTFRTWEYVSRILNNMEPGVPMLELIKGVIGEGPAAQFVAYLDIKKDLVSVDDILMNPRTAPVPDKPSHLCMLVGAISRRANAENMDIFFQYTKRIPKEFEAHLVSTLRSLKSPACDTRAMLVWQSENLDVYL